MSVTKTVYSLPPNWTASGLAQLVENGFVSAGYLPSGWQSRYASGTVENRILKIVNDNSKTYGTIYYWFQFSGTSFAVRTATNFQPNAIRPSGTEFADFTSPNSGSITIGTGSPGAITHFSGSSSLDVRFTVYRSNENSDCSFFLLRCGRNNALFTIPFGSYNALPFVDQNRMYYNGAVAVSPINQGATSNLAFTCLSPHLRNTHMGAISLYNETNNFDITAEFSYQRIAAAGIDNDNFPANLYDNTIVLLGTNPLTSTLSGVSFNAIYTAPSISPYNTNTSSDFAAAALYNERGSITVGDNVVVTSGIESWEVLCVASGGLSSVPACVFLARTT